jgi:ribose-phosphate pyrophosphokinase
MRAVYAMPGNEPLADGLARCLQLPRHALGLHRFPDGESLVRVAEPPAAGEAIVVCTLDRPDAKLLPLLMVAETLRELGARRVGLVAPYLAYMRQDRRFHPGEAVSSRLFGRLLADRFEWLVTVDPHLHRFHTLAEAGMPGGRAVSAAPALASWLRAHVERPLLIGPDEESTPWVESVAALIAAPFVVATKNRFGDREVRVDLPDLSPWRDRVPVLLDDMISSGHTLLDAIDGLRVAGLPAPWCVAVHGLFADDALARLRAAGVVGVVTTNSVSGEVAGIDVTDVLAAALPEDREGSGAGGTGVDAGSQAK